MSLKLFPELDAQNKTELLNKYFREKHQLEHPSGLPRSVHPNRLYYKTTGMFSKIEHLPPERD